MSDKKLSIRTKLLFGCGQGVESAVSFVANSFLLFYLTNVCKMSASLAGALIFVSLLIDAVADPAIGTCSDRFRSRWGRRLPFMAAALPVLAVACIAVFTAPAASTFALSAYVLIFNVALRLGTSLFALPYSAMTAEITGDYSERSSVAVYRCLFAFLGTVAVIAPAFGIIFARPDSMSSAAAYRDMGILTAVVVLFFGTACIVALYKTGHGEPAKVAPTHQSAWSDIRDLGRNRSFVLLFSACLLILVGAGSLNALNLFAFKYYWKLSTPQMQFPAMSAQIGLLLGIAVAALTLQKVEKRKALLVGMTVLTCFQGLPPLLFALSPAQPSSAVLLTVLCIVSFVFGTCCSLVFIAFQSMVADAVDEHEHRFGSRCEGLYYSSLVFGTKAAGGAGSLLAGLSLTLIGLGDASQTADVAISAQSAAWLGAIWGPGHALLFAMSIPLLAMYKLDSRAHAQIRHQLEQRLAARAL